MTPVLLIAYGHDQPQAPRRPDAAAARSRRDANIAAAAGTATPGTAPGALAANVSSTFSPPPHTGSSTTGHRSSRLAAEGGGNGGLLMGAALTQHPERTAPSGRTLEFDMLASSSSPTELSMSRSSARSRSPICSARSTRTRPITTWWMELVTPPFCFSRERTIHASTLATRAR